MIKILTRIQFPIFIERILEIVELLLSAPNNPLKKSSLHNPQL